MEYQKRYMDAIEPMTKKNEQLKTEVRYLRGELQRAQQEQMSVDAIKASIAEQRIQLDREKTGL